MVFWWVGPVKFPLGNEAQVKDGSFGIPKTLEPRWDGWAMGMTKGQSSIRRTWEGLTRDAWCAEETASGERPMLEARKMPDEDFGDGEKNDNCDEKSEVL